MYDGNNNRLTQAQILQIQAQLNNGNPTPPANGRIENNFKNQNTMRVIGNFCLLSIILLFVGFFSTSCSSDDENEDKVEQVTLYVKFTMLHTIVLSLDHQRQNLDFEFCHIRYNNLLHFSCLLPQEKFQLMFFFNCLISCNNL